ncbi:ATP-binding cassette domain-containing protein [Pseudomonas sp. No.117]
MFDLKGVTFAIAERVLLHPLDLRLEPGRLIGLIGPNGSGKSTLIKLLARQYRPTSGQVSFDGRPLPRWNTREFARNVAYLPQDPPATDDLSVRELVAFGRYPWHRTLSRFNREDARQVDRALDLTGTERFATQPLATLSGGERQRVWLAMLLAQNTRFLLLDEPTSALDIAHQIEMLALVRELCVTLRLGVVVVLHEINMAARYCQDLIALRNGRLLTRGTPEQLIKPKSLSAIYGIDMGVLPHPVDGSPLSYSL